MLKYFLPLIFLHLLCYQSMSQIDSIELNEVSIRAYATKQPPLRVPAALSVVDSSLLNAQNPQSLVAAVNAVPGVRMEERSPGSYRLSIRGSLLRSPFGIRNVKVYIDEFALTDAGGNTYLNLIDASLVQRIDILRGPDGSLFGANSGGVVRLKMNPANDSSFISGGIDGGSYGLIHEHITVQFHKGKNKIAFSQAWQQSDGYRENSNLKRKYFQLTDHFDYRKNAQLRFFIFYSDLNYRTPGGLTKTQFEKDPRKARPASAIFPGAADQKAGVHNETLYGGVLNEIKFSKHTSFLSSVFGSITNFENPFITNYETRKEYSMGLRSWFQQTGANEKNLSWTCNLGTELQQSGSQINNYGNRYGVKDTVQASKKLKAFQDFIFGRFTMDYKNKWIAELSLSLNFNHYDFTDILSTISTQRNVFNPQLMPRIAVSYSVNSLIAWRLILSKGYSPPTLAEILSSGSVLNKQLAPESGYNYETGIRFRERNGRLFWDVSVFYYRLQNAIVRRVDDNGNEYFKNAGGTSQTGLESELLLALIPSRTSGFIRSLQLRNSYTASRFLFSNYLLDTINYSGKFLTGIPKHVLVSSISCDFPFNFFIFIQHNYTSSIPLNDANTFFTGAYQTLQLKAGWKYNKNEKFNFSVYAGCDNITNTIYSPASDLNAAGGRYYNAAAGRNYYLGIRIKR